METISPPLGCGLFVTVSGSLLTNRIWWRELYVTPKVSPKRHFTSALLSLGSSYLAASCHVMRALKSLWENKVHVQGTEVSQQPAQLPRHVGEPPCRKVSSPAPVTLQVTLTLADVFVDCHLRETEARTSQ